RDRTIGSGQTDPPACCGWSGRTGQRPGRRRRPGHLGAEHRQARRVPTAQPRIRLPVLQLGADADRGGERVAATSAGRWAEPISRRPRRGATATGRARRPRAAPAGRTLGRTNAKGGGGARAGGPAIHHSRRRANRKPGQPFFDRGLGSPALAVRRRRRGGRPGDTRPGGGALRYPRAASGRRARVRRGYRRAHRGAMMKSLRAGWLSFRRIHLAALIADWRRTLLSVIGVAVGVTVVLGTLTLKSELTRPFDAFGPSLTHAADVGVVQVTPNVSGRLPIKTVDRLHAEGPGAEAVIPIVAGLTPVDVAGGSHGFFLLGGSCQIELLVGSFNCEQRARDHKPADGPGVPLQIPAVIAQRHGLKLGDELHIPGLPPGSAHLGWTFPEFDRVEGINGGYVLLAPSMNIAASMLGSAGYATAAFVLPRGGADITADIDRVTAGIAMAGAPRPHQPAMVENATQSFNLTVLAGCLIGFLVAVNTILLAIEDRRAVMGTIGAIGARPVGLFGGMLGEGAVVGVLGGLLGVPTGFLLGTFLVGRFGQSMLEGSGGTIAAHFTPSLIVIGAA